MAQKKWKNPFYALLIPAGAAFVVTGFAYGFMAFQMVNAGAGGADLYADHPLFAWLRAHGSTAMLVELAVLAVLTVGAIGTDSLWTSKIPMRETPQTIRNGSRLSFDGDGTMLVKQSQHVPQTAVDMEGAAGCQVQILVGSDEQAPNFVMRRFELAPGGHTPRHFHPYEHEIYMLEGSGVVVDGEVQRPLSPGDVVYVAPDDVHQFRNTGETPMKMLCLIPNSATGKNVTVVPECGLEQ